MPSLKPLEESNKLIPEKSPQTKSLPPLNKPNSNSKNTILSPANDEDFQHSINSTPLAHKENVIPIKIINTSLENNNTLKTPNKGSRKISLSFNNSPIPDLTPPSSTKIYNTINDTPKRSVSSPINLHKSNSLGIRKVSTPLTKRRVSKNFKSPLQKSSSSSSSLSSSSSIINKNSGINSQLKSLSKKNESFDLIYEYSKKLDEEINTIKKQNSSINNYKNLKLNLKETLIKDEELIEKWKIITKQLSESLLELQKENILMKHETFRSYKLSKFESFRKNSKWQLLNSIDEKFEQKKETDEFSKLSNYDKKNFEKEYEFTKKKTLEEFNKISDEKFKIMFKKDIEMSLNDKISNNYINNENDIINDYDMEDLYKDLKLDYEQVFN